jgi:hypothetical protein
MHIPCRHVAGHMFVELPEGRWLVDTGSPMTFGSPGAITWAGTRRAVPKSYGPVSLERIQPYIDVPFVGLIGVDLMNAQDLFWDGPAGVCRIGDGDISPSAVTVPMPTLLGVPMLDLLIGGQPARFILDTGAPFGYVLDERLTSNAAEDGRIRDFSPIVGDIDSPAWRADIDLGGIRFTERVGLLEGLGRTALSLLSVDGILGCSWLRSRQVWYRAAANVLGIGANP